MVKRLVEPDFIKGICIILMIYGHVTHIGTYSVSQKDVTAFIYTFHMPIFLIISGFFFRLIDDSKEQFWKTIKNIVIPFIVFEILYLVGLILIEKIGIPTSNKGPQSLLLFLDRIFLHPIGGYWFLHSLAIIMLGLILINRFIKNQHNTFLFIVFTLALFSVLDILTIVKIRTATYFLSGYFISILCNKKIHIPVSGAAVCIVLSILLFNIHTLEIYKFSPSEFIWCFLLFSVFWATATLSENLLTTKIIYWIGQNTLIILVMHAFFIVAFKMASGISLKIDPTGISYSILATCVTIVGSLLFARLFDTLSISKYLFNKEKTYTPFN